MRTFLLAGMMLTASIGIGASTAGAQSYTSATACRAAMAWDAAAAKCVSCKSLVTDSKSLKSCTACKAGTAFDISAARCVKITVKR
jgi:hypothetical protein